MTWKEVKINMQQKGIYKQSTQRKCLPNYRETSIGAAAVSVCASHVCMSGTYIFQ